MNITNFFKSKKLKLGKIIVAVSGGPDSMALLDMLQKMRPKLQVVAAHVDHQMRPDSLLELKLLQKYCTERQIKLVNYIWTKDKHPKTGLEAAAREMRYKFLTDLAKTEDAAYIATAHHNGDVLENILIKFLRSGNPEEMNSLSAVSKMHGVTLIRPLLAYDKAMLLNYDKKNEIKFILDQTNFQNITLRNVLRNNVEPILKKVQPDLNDKVDTFVKKMNLLDSLADQAFVNVKVESILSAYRIKKASLLQFDLQQKQWYFEHLIWQKWHRHINLNGKTSGFEIVETKNYYYVIKHNALVSQPIIHIDLEQEFVFGNEKYVLTKSKQADYNLIGSFWDFDRNDFSIGSTPLGQKLRLANGQHVKSKKKFAEKQIPLLLRSSCLTIFAKDEVEFIQDVYQYQTRDKSFKRYYIYQIQ